MARNVSIGICLVLFLSLLSGCGRDVVFEQHYDPYLLSANASSEGFDNRETLAFFAEDLAVGLGEDQEGIWEGLFDMNGLTIPKGSNLYDRRPPASTTKIMTAYVALKHGNLSDMTTVGESISNLSRDSSFAHISAGDQLSLEQLLYGLLLVSGNDAAVAIAEMVSGSEAAFVDLMNQEALALGATGTHFVNSHGLHEEEHYTTVYDLYLMFNAALEYDLFRTILGTPHYTAVFPNHEGLSVTRNWDNSNWYITGETETPEGIVVLGGKTGTTTPAGSCLVLFSNSPEGMPYISVVLNASSRNNLYSQMSELLQQKPPLATEGTE